MLLVAAVAAGASACAAHQPTIRVLPPALPPGAYEPAPAAPVAPRPAAAGLETVRIAETVIGAPYREGGALPDGFDCSGLVTWVFARLGIAVPRDVRRQAAFGIDVPRGEVASGRSRLLRHDRFRPDARGHRDRRRRVHPRPEARRPRAGRVDVGELLGVAVRRRPAHRQIRRVEPGRNWRITRSSSVKCRRGARCGSGTTWAARGPRGWSASRSR